MVHATASPVDFGSELRAALANKSLLRRAFLYFLQASRAPKASCVLSHGIVSLFLLTKGGTNSRRRCLGRCDPSRLDALSRVEEVVATEVVQPLGVYLVADPVLALAVELMLLIPALGSHKRQRW